VNDNQPTMLRRIANAAVLAAIGGVLAYLFHRYF
jgi:hypothetical protein